MHRDKTRLPLPCSRVSGSIFVVTLEGGSTERAELLRDMMAEGVKVTGYTTVSPPLETMYMDLVKESR